MAEIINFQNNIKVIRDNDITTFYEKFSGGVQLLEAKIESGDLVIINKLDGTELERFDYSGVKTPTSIDIQDLLDQIHFYVIAQQSQDVKDVFFRVGGTSNRGDYSVQNIAANSSGYFMFNIPDDFSTLQNLWIYFIPSAGAAGATKDIDLLSDYAMLDENLVINSESDVATVYDFTGKTDTLTRINIASVFSSIEAGHICGLQVKHNSIGGSMDYLGIKMEYLAG